MTLKLERPETEIYIIDMKRLEFSFFGSYSWYAYTMQEAIRMLEHLYKELHRRLKLLDKAGCVNIQEYHQQGYELPYCVLALDEFSQWTKTWWAKAYRNDGPFRFPPVVVVCKGLKRKNELLQQEKEDNRNGLRFIILAEEELHRIYERLFPTSGAETRRYKTIRTAF